MLNRPTGLTLVELMIVIVVLGIILSLAYPGYQSQMQKTRRADGQKMLLEIMQEQQQFFSLNSTFTTNLVTDLGYPDAGGGTVLSEQQFYLVNAQICPPSPPNTVADCVLLTATAQGAQTADGDLTYNSRNEKTPAAKW